MIKAGQIVKFKARHVKYFSFFKKKKKVKNPQNYLIEVATNKPQRFTGHLSQMAAALTHYLSPSRLAFIGARIPKIVIVTGDKDDLVAPEGSRKLWRGMVARNQEIDGRKGTRRQDPRVELVQWEGAGHGIHIQREREFNELIARCVKEGRTRNLNGVAGLS